MGIEMNQTVFTSGTAELPFCEQLKNYFCSVKIISSSLLGTLRLWGHYAYSERSARYYFIAFLPPNSL